MAQLRRQTHDFSAVAAGSMGIGENVRLPVRVMVNAGGITVEVEDGREYHVMPRGDLRAVTASTHNVYSQCPLEPWLSLR
jgi:hypothetical protein